MWNGKIGRTGVHEGIELALLVVPIAIALEFLAPERHILIFFASSLAILLLAGWMGRATEQSVRSSIAHHNWGRMDLMSVTGHQRKSQPS